MKRLELVCIGNNGRSPILEAVFKDEAKRMKVEDYVDITSSGVYVTRRHPIPMMIDTINKVRDISCFNIYERKTERLNDILEFFKDPASLIEHKDGEKEVINLADGCAIDYETLLKTKDDYIRGSTIQHLFLNELTNLFYEAYRVFQGLDVAFRDNVLSRHYLKYKSERSQFPSREGLNYVLTSTASLLEPAEEMIKETNYYPLICSLQEFTGVPDIKGGFGCTDIGFYEKMYESARKAAPIALEKILSNNAT